MQGHARGGARSRLPTRSRAEMWRCAKGRCGAGAETMAETGGHRSTQGPARQLVNQGTDLGQAVGRVSLRRACSTRCGAVHQVQAVPRPRRSPLTGAAARRMHREALRRLLLCGLPPSLPLPHHLRRGAPCQRPLATLPAGGAGALPDGGSACGPGAIRRDPQGTHQIEGARGLLSPHVVLATPTG